MLYGDISLARVYWPNCEHKRLKMYTEMTQQNLQFHFGADRERNVQFTMRNVLVRYKLRKYYWGW